MMPEHKDKATYDFMSGVIALGTVIVFGAVILGSENFNWLLSRWGGPIAIGGLLLHIWFKKS